MRAKMAFAVLLVVSLLSSVCAEIARSGATQKSQQGKKEAEYSGAEIISKIDEIYEKLKKEDIKDNPLYPTQFVSYRSTVEAYSNYSKLEKETRIYKDWFVKLTKILKAMEPCRVEMKIAIMNKDRELYAKSKQYYDKCFKAFEETYKNPAKIKGNR